MDDSYGKRAADPYAKHKERLQESFADLNTLKHVYVHGEPGSGKSHMVELFYECLDVGARKKKMHYNEFMLLMHEMEHKVNQMLKGKTGETVGIVGNQFAQDLTFFFVDEFQVLDIADAMILKRLFESFIENRMVVFFTSNRPPEDLYLNGLQRFLFMPFIDLVNEKSHVLNLSSIDYRLLNQSGKNNYFHPLGPETAKQVDETWNQLTNNAKGAFQMVEVAQSRTIPVSKAAKGVAEFTFKELCEEARGSPDYSAIAKQFNSIILRGVPQQKMTRRDLMRRFILLIDALYYQHRNVVIEAECELDSLFAVDANAQQTEVFDEEFAYTRCVSRLKEMQTKEYQESVLSQSHKTKE